MLVAAVGPAFGCGAVTVWFWITCLIGLVWLKRHIDVTRGRNEPVLQADESGVDEATLPNWSGTVILATDRVVTDCGDGVEAKPETSLPHLSPVPQRCLPRVIARWNEEAETCEPLASYRLNNRWV